MENQKENQSKYFEKGDLVKVRQFDNSPKMVVIKSISTYLTDNGKTLHGIQCFWFTNNNTYQEQVFNTKDLVKV